MLILLKRLTVALTLVFGVGVLTFVQVGRAVWRLMVTLDGTPPWYLTPPDEVVMDWSLWR